MINEKLLLNANIKAFLFTIRVCEGTDGENGFRTIYGGTRTNPILFDNNFVDHPRQMQGPQKLRSDAAGAFQILSTTWDQVIQPCLHLPDFSPLSQQLGALLLISNANALDDVWTGNFETAITKCAKCWASLPGSPYGQPTHKMPEAVEIYRNAGGSAIGPAT